jgi:(p)ppGpp synthase/HD superfamily hydrolase
MVLSSRFAEAFQYAFQLHQYQTRKDGPVPYMAHLMGVASLVLEDGGGEDEAIAALLHDAPEDQGGKVVLEEIKQRFGEQVAIIVDGCTDSYAAPKPAWRKRKERYISHLSVATPEILRVSLADKLHNARAIESDLDRFGDSIWKRFNGGKEGTLWYYRSLVREFRKSTDSVMLKMLEEAVSRIEALAADPNEEENASLTSR